MLDTSEILATKFLDGFPQTRHAEWVSRMVPGKFLAEWSNQAAAVGGTSSRASWRLRLRDRGYLITAALMRTPMAPMRLG
jgi:hypothetical protein